MAAGDRLRAYDVLTATIANGGTTSNALDIRGYTEVGFVLPTMTGTAITYQVSADGTTFGVLYDKTGTAISVTTASSRAFPVHEAAKAFGFLKLVSGSAEGAARTIKVVVK